ncbi:DUF4262 domain-containing protein [Litorimonas sp.]|uniref:DUF4262 domain-containing protein n=1 Tax=Litorimonas sp. TaxID=1892381 RepID=UPI003A88D387
MTSKSEGDVNKFEKNILEHIREHGFSTNHVFDPEGENPSLTYSIGFPTTLSCPDFIIFGLPKDLMHGMIWDIFHAITSGKTPSDGEVWPKLLEGDFLCVSKEVHPDNYFKNYLNSAVWYHKHTGRDISNFRAFQMVWPGVVDKKYPWEEGDAEAVIKAQTPLWFPNLP